MTYNFWVDGAASMKKVNGEYVREAGGWASALVVEDNILEYVDYGRENETTNNRMELMAIAEGLSYYYFMKFTEGNTDTINIYSDSAYCVNIYTQWIKSWEANGWYRGKKKELIENVELIRFIWELVKNIRKAGNIINFIKVKGHSNNKWNNYVDDLAVKAKTGVIKDKGNHSINALELLNSWKR